jgi:hypothetical protein
MSYPNSNRYNSRPRNNSSALINGRRINTDAIPAHGVSGRMLKQQIHTNNGRRIIMENEGKVQQVRDDKLYHPHELMDRHGKGAKITTMPDRSKGAQFGGQRSRASFELIWEQVVDIAKNLFRQGVEFDEDNGDWLVVPNYRLPENWSQKKTPLLITFPTHYPEHAPVGFYLMEDIAASPNGHLYNQAYHNADKEPLKEGWKWYCVYVENGSWQPARNWRNGDNLYTYFHLIHEALSGGND